MSVTKVQLIGNVSTGSSFAGIFVEGDARISGVSTFASVDIQNDLNVSGVTTSTSFSGSGANLTNIPNAALVNSNVSYGGVTLSLGSSDATPAFDLTDAINYSYTSLTGITTSIVGDNTPQLGGNLDINGNYVTGTGGINITGVITAVNFNSTSDINLKKDIEVIQNATEILKEINGVKFSWKENDVKSIGVIAQDVEKVLPELVQTTDKETKTVNYDGLIGVLIEAIKDQQGQIDELKGKID